MKFDGIRKQLEENNFKIQGFQRSFSTFEEDIMAKMIEKQKEAANSGISPE